MFIRTDGCDPELAHLLYRSAVRFLGLLEERFDLRERGPVLAMGVVFTQLALVLALEFGDELVASRLRPVLEVVAEPRHFGDGHFGFFYHLGEPWPRGQLSALLMVAEVAGPGRWRRIFQNKDFRARFHAPAVDFAAFFECSVL